MLMISNVHERAYPVPAERLGPLLDDLGGPDDRLWPENWPPMRFDRPLEPGARGGHGPIRYDVTAVEPGRRVDFRFDPAIGFGGCHYVEVFDGERPGTSVLRHTLIARGGALARLRWAVAIRWLHDALLEDLLDRAAREAGSPPASPARWSPWVRLLRLVVPVGPRTPTRVWGPGSGRVAARSGRDPAPVSVRSARRASRAGCPRARRAGRSRR